MGNLVNMVDNNRFEEKAHELDQMNHEYIGQFGNFLPKPIYKLPLFQHFQEHLMYVIMAFLNEKNDSNSPQELFVQIPIVKYTNADVSKEDRLQQETRRKINGTVSSCLLLSTIESIYNNAKISKESLEEMSRWNERDNKEELGTAIYCEIDNEPQIVEFKTWQIPRPLSDTLYTFSPLKKKTSWIYNDQRRVEVTANKFKLLNNVLLLKRNGRYVKRDVIKDVEMIKRLAISTNVIKQFNNAALVHVGAYEPKNENIPIKSSYFDLVPTYSSIDNLSASLGRRDMMDVIIVVGDERYKYRRPSFRNCAAKKIIYIGTEPPCDDIPVYSFSYREMYRYCSPDGSRFKEPKMVRNIPFPWRDEALSNLKELLDELSESDDGLTVDVKRSIIRNLKTRFSNIDFNHESWNEQKYDIEFDFDCDPDTIDGIKEWCEGLEYSEESNPKMDVIRNLDVQPTLVFGKYWRKHLRYDNPTGIYLPDKNVDNTYISEFKKLVNIHNHIVIDSASYCRGQNDVPLYKAYKHLLKHHLFADVTALYYHDEENYAKALLWYLSKEFDCYNCEKRIVYETSIHRNDIIDSTIVELPDEEILFTLEDFMDANDSSDSWNVSESKQIIVTFRDGHQDRIDGDVLIKRDNGYERTKIQLLEDRDFNEENIEIVYYVNPEEFERYMMSQFVFKEGLDIYFYENMWKKALRDYISKGNRQKLVEKISDKTNITKDKLLRYLNDNCRNKFLGSGREMNRLCELLSTEGYIRHDDIINIILAKNAYDSFKKNGKKLKKDALDYKMSSRNRIPTIRTISRRLYLTVDEIVDSCLSTGVISNIEIN